MIGYSPFAGSYPANLSAPFSAIAPAMPGTSSASALLGTSSPADMASLYDSIRDHSTYVPGNGWIPSNRIQTDSRGSWIGGAMPLDLSGPGSSSANPVVPTSASYASEYGAYSPNPHQGELDSAIRQQFTDWLTQDALPGIQSHAVGSGGVGGGRQGVAQGLAIGEAAKGLASALATSHYGDYTGSMNRGLQRYGMDQSFYLGNRNTDLSQMRAGADLYNMGNAGWLSQGEGLASIGKTLEQAPWQTIGNYTSNLAPFTGFGGTTTTASSAGGQGVLGGMLAGGQLARLWGGGWGSTGGNGNGGWHYDGTTYNNPSAYVAGGY